MLPFADRTEAGQRLAEALSRYAGRRDLLVLALPRGGVPVAFEVAERLGAELDVIVVRKLGVPYQEELAMGAIASGGAKVLNQDVIASIGLSEDEIETVAQREAQELARRERIFRGERPFPQVKGRTVILVDDGLATGATMRAAVAALRQLEPSAIVVAVPVAPPDTAARLRAEVDDLVCLATPEAFYAVGQWYVDFSQLSDEDVRDLLAKAWERGAFGH
ncbi:MAG: phosphoribosyltransferase [Methylohalobius sp.]|nr:phosphoribosyltransferase [Methylohalobius sp.]